jgi:tetratricopeptide (TPR) repeat protein
MFKLQGDLIRERFGMTGYPAVLARGYLAWCLGDVGEFAEGRAYADEAVRLAEEVDQPFSQAVLRIVLGYFYIGQGDLRTAISLLEHSRALIARWDLPRIAANAASLLGVAQVLNGQSIRAVSLLEEATTHLEHVKGSGEVGARLATSALCEGYLLAGCVGQAAQFAARMLKTCRQRKLRASEAHALRLLGNIAIRRDPPEVDEAEGRYRESLALAEELEMRPLQAHCHLGLGKLYGRTGRAREACIELSAAVEMLRAMEMEFWVPEAESELVEAERALKSSTSLIC